MFVVSHKIPCMVYQYIIYQHLCLRWQQLDEGFQPMNLMEDSGICECSLLGYVELSLLFLRWSIWVYNLIIFHQHQSWTCRNSTCSTCNVQGGFSPTPSGQNKKKSPTDSLTHPDAMSSAFSKVSIFWWIFFWFSWGGSTVREWVCCNAIELYGCFLK